MSLDLKDREALLNELLGSPEPTTREEYLARKDIRRKLSRFNDEVECHTKKAGYSKLKKLGGQVTGGMNNGMQ